MAVTSIRAFESCKNPISLSTLTKTFAETVLLKVHVVEPQRSLTELGNVPLVVSEFYGLSNANNSSVLTFKNQPEVICTVHLLSSEINIPMLGQLVTEDPESMVASEPGPRKGRRTGMTCPGNKACDHNTREVFENRLRSSSSLQV
ncbi:hypothetical protein cypCar_00019946 [Cyprinus carpio]|nr:hypothetical protein cypCar_00019946 [Cyprinus carpio]